jgi:hypothetical protein
MFFGYWQQYLNGVLGASNMFCRMFGERFLVRARWQRIFGCTSALLFIRLLESLDPSVYLSLMAAELLAQFSYGLFSTKGRQSHFGLE